LYRFSFPKVPDGILKTISEAKEVTGEYKYKSPFNFTVRTVPVLLCNNIPSLADLSHGMLRRLQVIPFDRTFTGDDKDSGLFDRIWADELPGVLNRALRGKSPRPNCPINLRCKFLHFEVLFTNSSSNHTRSVTFATMAGVTRNAHALASIRIE
jgi:hypothetical protein